MCRNTVLKVCIFDAYAHTYPRAVCLFAGYQKHICGAESFQHWLASLAGFAGWQAMAIMLCIRYSSLSIKPSENMQFASCT